MSVWRYSAFFEVDVCGYVLDSFSDDHPPVESMLGGWWALEEEGKQARIDHKYLFAISCIQFSHVILVTSWDNVTWVELARVRAAGRMPEKVWNSSKIDTCLLSIECFSLVLLIFLFTWEAKKKIWEKDASCIRKENCVCRTTRAHVVNAHSSLPHDSVEIIKKV